MTSDALIHPVVSYKPSYFGSTSTSVEISAHMPAQLMDQWRVDVTVRCYDSGPAVKSTLHMENGEGWYVMETLINQICSSSWTG